MEYKIEKAQGPYQQFHIILENNTFTFFDFGGFHDRNESTIKIIINALKENEEFFVGKNLSVRVNTSDQMYDGCFNYAHPNKYFTIPCFGFDHWKQVGIDDYLSMVSKIKEASKIPYTINKILWSGSVGPWIPSRVIFKELANSHPDILFCNEIDFSVGNPTQANVINQQLAVHNFISLPDHCNYKYLLDIEGMGWSARLKYLCFTNRVLFVNDRPFKEFWMDGLVDGENCIIVKRDLSDLVEKLHMVEKNPELYEKLSKNLNKFAEENLTIECVNNHVIEVLNRIIN